jgi:hypothetical protein
MRPQHSVPFIDPFITGNQLSFKEKSIIELIFPKDKFASTSSRIRNLLVALFVYTSTEALMDDFFLVSLLASSGENPTRSKASWDVNGDGHVVVFGIPYAPVE